MTTKQNVFVPMKTFCNVGKKGFFSVVVESPDGTTQKIFFGFGTRHNPTFLFKRMATFWRSDLAEMSDILFSLKSWVVEKIAYVFRTFPNKSIHQFSKRLFLVLFVYQLTCKIKWIWFAMSLVTLPFPAQISPYFIWGFLGTLLQ